MALVYGIGINEQDRPIREGGKQTKEYTLWQSMLFRCTTKCWDKFPTYTGVTCSENFKSYAFFYDWCQTQIGFGNTGANGKRWCLDKDVLFKGNKHYSEDTCIFIPHRINTLLTKSNATRGEYPIGVYWNKRELKFKAKCCGGDGYSNHLGYYSTAQEAFTAYKTFKEVLISQTANEYKHQLDERVYQALLAYTVEITD